MLERERGKGAEEMDKRAGEGKCVGERSESTGARNMKLIEKGERRLRD